MTSQENEIVIFSDDGQLATGLARAFKAARVHLFKAAYLAARKIITEPGFDALYWTLPAAERWNVRPIEDKIQIIQTSAKDRDEGWPPFLLVGLALSPQNAVNVEGGLRTWSQALLTALREPLAASINRVKVPLDMISLESLTPERIANILADAEEQAS